MSPSPTPSGSPVASTSRAAFGHEAGHSAQPKRQGSHIASGGTASNSPPRNLVPLRRSSTVGDLYDPKVHVDLAKPERALTAERLAYWNSTIKPQKRPFATFASSLNEPSSDNNSSSSHTNFVDLFVGKGPAARHHAYAHPSPQSQDASPPPAPAQAEKETSLLDGPTTWLSNLMGSSRKPESPSSSTSNATAAAAAATTAQASSGAEADDQAPEQLLDEADQIARDWHVLKDAYKTPKLPLVFCHGLFGFEKIKVGPEGFPMLQVDYWRGIRKALEEAGVEVLITQVPASASIQERAKTLCDIITRRMPGREINLIGHSMGGLDARLLVSHLKPKDFKVRSITTVATPHRGSTFADYFVNDFIGKNNMPMVLSVLGTLQVPGGGKAFEELTTQSMARFNEDFPDVPEVKYYSYGARCQPSLIDAFRMSWGIIRDVEGDNDGLVSVESAMWGKYIGTLENVNHLDLVGWIGQFRYSFAEWTGKPIQYRPASFYLSVSEMLAKEGF